MLLMQIGDSKLNSEVGGAQFEAGIWKLACYLPCSLSLLNLPASTFARALDCVENPKDRLINHLSGK